MRERQLDQMPILIPCMEHHGPRSCSESARSLRRSLASLRCSGKTLRMISKPRAQEPME